MLAPIKLNRNSGLKHHGEQSQMPSELDGKQAVVTHQRMCRTLWSCPRALCDEQRGGGIPTTSRPGDKLHALKALLPRYAGQGEVLYSIRLKHW